MTYDVFVSYSSKDKAVADGIVSTLEQNGIRCWYAPRDIKPSEDWGKAITNAIQEAKLFLVVFSGSANQSQHVLDELLLAINLGVVVLPFRIENMEPEGAMKLHLASRHWLDAFDPSWDKHLKVLVTNTSTILDTSLEENQIELPKIIKKKSRKSPRKMIWFAPIGIIVIFLGILLVRGGSPLQMFERDTNPASTTSQIESTNSIKVSPVDGMNQVYIPPGSFIMGSNTGVKNERPVHMVDLSAFWIDEHEVTNAQFTVFLEEQGKQNEDIESWLDTTDQDNPITLEEGKWVSENIYSDHPVINVSWHGAQAFCLWAGRRLPTEAEWEKAARGGQDEKKFPWGDQLPVCVRGEDNGARYDDDLDCDSKGTAAVMSYAPNGYGLYDMSGNVWEWVNDWYLEYYYNISPEENPQGPAIGLSRVLRGGGWFTDAYHARAAYRNWDGPSYSFNVVGFRCAETPD